MKGLLSPTLSSKGADGEARGFGHHAVSANACDSILRIVNYHANDFFEVPWLMRLLKGREVEVVRDTSQTRTFENSIVLCTRLGHLKPELLDRINKTPAVVLYHISDEWYREPLNRYGFFTHVIRNYYHTGLSATPVIQFPLGPSHASGTQLNSPPARERKYIWSFAGRLISTRRCLLDYLEAISPHYAHMTSGLPSPKAAMNRDQYLELLSESVFVPCAMGNVNLESFRIYEALDCGAIPILERRPWLDYFTRLFGEHPLPSVNHWNEGAELMRCLLANPSSLEQKQIQIQEWWTQFQNTLSTRFAKVIDSAAAQKERALSKMRFPGRLRGRLELLKHHNPTAVWARLCLTWSRLKANRTVRLAE